MQVCDKFEFDKLHLQSTIAISVSLYGHLSLVIKRNKCVTQTTRRSLTALSTRIALILVLKKR